MQNPNQISLSEDDPLLAISNIKRWFWFFVLFLIFFVDLADRSILSAVLPGIKKEFLLSDAQAGAISGALYISMVVLAVPCGFLVDRFSRKFIISIMVAVWSLATWFSGAARSFSTLLFSRMMVGAGEAGYGPASLALIAAWFPKRMHGTVVGFFYVAQTLGIGLGMSIGGHLSQKYGWRSVFGLMAIPGIILSILVMFAPDYDHQNLFKVKTAVQTSLFASFKDLFSVPSLKLIFIGQMPIVFHVTASVLWGMVFLVRSFNLSLSQASDWVALSTLFTMLGSAFFGWYSDRSRNDSRNSRVVFSIRLIFCTILFSSVSVLSPVFHFPFLMAFAAMCLGSFFIAGAVSVLVTSSLDLTPAESRGAAQSLGPLFSAIAAIPAGATIGFFSDHLGLPIALELSLITCYSLSIFLLSRAKKTFNEDYFKLRGEQKHEAPSNGFLP